jgi:CheY-like chemotaxis protein
MLRRAIEEHIRIELSIAPDLGTICADLGQLEQVLMNLAVNARDAMPDGGVLTIAASNVDLDERGRRHPELRPGRWVLIEVSDTGVGMTEEVRGRIFEPFFTTKEVGKGVGLGLATAYGILKQHGGTISVRTALGKGTTFEVWFPRSASAVAAAPEDADEALSAERGTETILVVEDNEAVRKLACELLRRLGYAVLSAEGGDQAIELARRHAGDIHLLLTDVVMPRMNGKQIATSLSSDRRGLRVLYMSGYAQDLLGDHGIAEESMSFIQKPLSLEPLSRKVRAVLDA